MEAAKRISLGARKKSKRKHIGLVRSIVAYLKSDAYLFAPLITNSPPFATQIDTHPPSKELPMAGFEALVTKRVTKKNKRRMSEKAKEYLNSHCHMYGPMISPLKLGSSLKGELQIRNFVTVEVSTSTTTMREDNRNYKHLRSDITEQALCNGRINSPKRPLVSLEGQQTTGLTRETDLSPAFSSLPGEKMVKPVQRKVAIE